MSEAKKKSFNPEVNSALCKECGYCCEVCEQQVFENSGMFNKAGYRYVIPKHADNCNGCMKCFLICPDFAIMVEQTRGNQAPSVGRTTPAEAS
jgi:NAD-dependent dihydropyrimidine dehydrogenase PreA subunit